MAGYFDNSDQVIILNSGGYSTSQAFVFQKNLFKFDNLGEVIILHLITLSRFDCISFSMKC